MRKLILCLVASLMLSGCFLDDLWSDKADEHDTKYTTDDLIPEGKDWRNYGK